MRLEVGKTYRDRSGEFITILGKSGMADYPFDGRDGTGYVATYREDGTFKDTHSEFDLVEEYVYVPAVETKSAQVGPISAQSAPIPQTVSFRDQLARDLFVHRTSDLLDAFDLADRFIDEARRRG